jgi:nitroreductase
VEVFEAVQTVLAVRQFKSDPIPADVVREIVEAGHLTASSMNGQPWHFIIVEDAAMLGQLGAIARSGPYITQAPLAIIVAVQKSSPYGMSDGSRAIQSMVLTAWAKGIGSNWVGFANLAAVNSLVDLPEEYEIIAILPMGYPVNPSSQGKKKRKPLGEIASRERFGHSFE